MSCCKNSVMPPAPGALLHRAVRWATLGTGTASLLEAPFDGAEDRIRFAAHHAVSCVRHAVLRIYGFFVNKLTAFDLDKDGGFAGVTFGVKRHLASDPSELLRGGEGIANFWTFG